MYKLYIAIGHYFKSISTLTDTKLQEMVRDVRDWEFSQVSTSSPADYQSTGNFSGKIRALYGPKKLSFKFFEIFLLSELVCTYNKLNIDAKKFCVIGTLSFSYNLRTKISTSCSSVSGSEVCSWNNIFLIVAIVKKYKIMTMYVFWDSET